MVVVDDAGVGVAGTGGVVDAGVVHGDVGVVVVLCC